VGAHGATWALTLKSASVSQAIEGLVGKGNSKAIIARFDIGVVLPVHRE